MTDQAPDHIWITPYVPDDPPTLAAIAEIALRHSHLDHMLRMMVKSLTNVDVTTALRATKREGSASLRRRIQQLAKKRLGDGEPLVRLQALLHRCQRLTERRNRLIHNIWAQQVDGDSMVQNDDLEWEPIPSVEELHQLAGDLIDLQRDMNDARLHGWLQDALQATSNAVAR